jgi:hypothetical protein
MDAVPMRGRSWLAELPRRHTMQVFFRSPIEADREKRDCGRKWIVKIVAQSPMDRIRA